MGGGGVVKATSFDGINQSAMQSAILWTSKFCLNRSLEKWKSATWNHA